LPPAISLASALLRPHGEPTVTYRKKN